MFRKITGTNSLRKESNEKGEMLLDLAAEFNLI